MLWTTNILPVVDSLLKSLSFEGKQKFVSDWTEKFITNLQDGVACGRGSSVLSAFCCFFVALRFFLSMSTLKPYWGWTAEYWEAIQTLSSPNLDYNPLKIEPRFVALTIPPLPPKRWRKGKRSGLGARLHANPHRPALPSLFLANARSLTNKEGRKRFGWGLSHRIDSCLAVFHEIWLNNDISDAAVEIEGCSLLWADKTAASAKLRSGGLAIYIHNSWCTAANNRITLLPWPRVSGWEMQTVQNRVSFAPSWSWPLAFHHELN